MQKLLDFYCRVSYNISQQALLRQLGGVGKVGANNQTDKIATQTRKYSDVITSNAVPSLITGINASILRLRKKRSSRS